MTIAGACRPPTGDYAGGWQAAGGLLSTLLGEAPTWTARRNFGWQWVRTRLRPDDSSSCHGTRGTVTTAHSVNARWKAGKKLCR